MVRIELTDEEAVTLREVLTSYPGDLRMEVANTDSMDFRESLKQTEVLLKALIDRLRPG
jgi:hypothetical protein